MNVRFLCFFKCNNLKVRGAPAIAIVGCLSIAVKLRSSEEIFSEMKIDDLISKIKCWVCELVDARPTAVNMQTSASELNKIFEMQKNNSTIHLIKMLVKI